MNDEPAGDARDEMDAPWTRPRARRYVVVASGFALGAAALGFGLGIEGGERDLAPPLPPARAPIEAPHESIPAPHYSQLGESPLRADREARTRLVDLVELEIAPPPAAPDARLRRAALEFRAGRRAYDGAPPVIPHPVDSRSAAACLACHGEGKAITIAPAKRIPHPPWASCTQCHVEQASSAFEDRVVTANRFEGAFGPEFAHRAGTGSPPVTPHSILLRQDCLACHGPHGEIGLRTSHPERQSCLQCHSPPASLVFPFAALRRP
jgi:cytochrome c-type protein NapB